MAWIYYDGRPYSDARYKEPAAPMTFQEPPYYDDGHHRGRYEEPAPLMFREPPYYDDGYYRRRYEEPAAPITFREPPYYDDGYHRDQYPVFSHGGYLIPREQMLVRAEESNRERPYFDDGYYRSIFRDQYPVFNRGGHLMPREQVLLRAEDPPLSGWHNAGYPYAGCIVERPQYVTEVELYAPQLCCDKCERRVGDCLNDMAGVESVTADQWQKKVVVVGGNLCPNDVLRRLQRDRHMNRSVLWHDR